MIIGHNITVRTDDGSTADPSLRNNVEEEISTKSRGSDVYHAGIALLIDLDVVLFIYQIRKSIYAHDQQYGTPKKTLRKHLPFPLKIGYHD